MTTHYRPPGWFTRNVFNRAVSFLTAKGVSVLGSRVLAVRGRTSGEWRTTPVNLLELDGTRYLVSPRGEGQWVRNLRVAGSGELRVGNRSEVFTSRELADDEKVPVLRAYLRRWKAEVGVSNHPPGSFRCSWPGRTRHRYDYGSRHLGASC